MELRVAYNIRMNDVTHMKGVTMETVRVYIMSKDDFPNAGGNDIMAYGHSYLIAHGDSYSHKVSLNLDDLDDTTLSLIGAGLAFQNGWAAERAVMLTIVE